MSSSVSSPVSSSVSSPPVSVTPSERCPCLSGQTYGECCGRFHTGEAFAPTAEQLMRSRYSAFAAGDTRYLLSTWHPRTRPRSLELDAGHQWVRLDIVRTIKGGPLDVDGVVEYIAHYREDGERHRQHETGRFVRVDRRWLFLDCLA